jgi:thiamine biosynthesis lipoprotein ApbE
VVVVATSRALSTGIQVAVTRTGALPTAQLVVARRLDDIDRAVSRFRPDSDVARINQAEGRAVAVSDLCLRAITVALNVAAATDGIVDPTVGTSMEALGYDRDFAEVGSTALGPVIAAAGWRCVEIDAHARTVRVPAGVHLDLGASAKALVADEAAAHASEAAGCGVLVNIGGDVAIAGSAPAGGWEVRVTDDHAAPADAPGQTIRIEHGGLATSSTTVRRWRRGDRDVHHIIDPRTGEPAAVVWRTVSVTASSCLDANAATTAAIVLGLDAPAWLSQCGLPARLVDVAGTVVHLNRWPAQGEQP